MVRRLLVSSIFVTSLVTSARADGPDGYVGAGVEAALGPFALATGSIALDGGYRLPGSQWYARGFVAIGGAGDDGPSGNQYQVAAGIEHRDCVHGQLLCLGSGVDAGFLTTSFASEGTAYSGPVVRLRSAVDIGGDRLRLRAGLDSELGFPIGCTTCDQMTGGRTVRFGVSLGVQLALVYLL